MKYQGLMRRDARVVDSYRSAGITLIEMLIVTTIVAILLSIAVPSFQYVTTSNRASSEINALLGDMQFARAEAIKEGLPVTICESNSGQTACTTGNTWQNGWIVLASDNVTVLKVQPSFANQDTLTADNGTTGVLFNRDGFAANSGGTAFAGAFHFTLHDPSGSSQFTRCLSVTMVGALSTQIGGGTTMETGAGSTC